MDETEGEDVLKSEIEKRVQFENKKSSSVEDKEKFSEIPLTSKTSDLQDNQSGNRKNDEPEGCGGIGDSGDDDSIRLKSISNRPRPSFTIGASDSDSVSASHSIESSKMPFNVSDDFYIKRSNIKPLPAIASTSERSSSSDNDMAVGRRGFMGGLGSSESRSRAGSRNALAETDVLNKFSDNSDDQTSDERIHMIATEGDSSSGFNKRQWLTFIVFLFVEFFSAMVISLQAPFYPAEAEKKGATATEYGFVFGVFELTVFIISPIYGSQMNKIGPKLVFNLGILTTATCSILFGFLDNIDDRTTFISLSIVTRIIEALGEAAFITASFVIIAAEFPNSVATTFATMETFYGFGLIIGPMAGGFLYQVGGYTLPFVTVGGLLLVAAFCTHFVLPRTRKIKELSEENEKSSGFQLVKLFKVPAIALAAFSIFTASTSIGYLNATLEPHIRQFNLTPFTTGTVFIVAGGTYAMSAPLWGWLCDRITQLKYITLIGSLLIIIGFSLIGPIPYLPLETSLWAVIVGQVIQGIGLGAVLVSAFIEGLRDAIKAGFSDDIGTYGLISGMWTSMFALGSFVGPSLSGILYDYVGFRTGTLVVVGLQLIVMFAVICFLVCKCEMKPEALEEMDPLLPATKAVASTSKGHKTYKEVYGAI